ncbi:carbohydrate kinase family protein [Sulfobacillus harzensis]|uniref:Carbohydrate kinase family protein n=1 Tax=Sulfobacillus harzensis TaxID=2729629 RepID=A0A7Y0L5J1_9FIRM|nr:carbohydrate kinase family protein [Sulfobacillus harzensis]NMP22269.1 carbohydrate kinase family protein [Sulfobacillus harzensis]
MYDLIVYGIAFADMVYADIPHLPEPGEEVYAGSFAFAGGAAYITAVAAARLGLKVALIAPFGNDAISRLLEEMLAREGVDTGLLFRAERPVYSITVAINHGGDRAFLSYQEGMDVEGLSLHAVHALEQVNAKWVHLGAGHRTAEVARVAKRQGMSISMDVGWDEAWLKSEELKSVIALADLFMPNLKEAQAITGSMEATRAAEQLGSIIPFVVVKLGPEGALLKLRSAVPQVVEAPRVDRVRDTTGAGDNFASGMLYGLIRGMDASEAVRVGNFCGSESTKGLGGNGTSPSLEALKDWLSVQESGATR